MLNVGVYIYHMDPMGFTRKKNNSTSTLPPRPKRHLPVPNARPMYKRPKSAKQNHFEDSIEAPHVTSLKFQVPKMEGVQLKP